ncbi:MAG: hypothetical protein ABIP30_01090 [Ferruginibacter sp.]
MPSVSNFEIKIALPSKVGGLVAERLYVPGPGSKSVVPLKLPVVYTFPLRSTYKEEMSVNLSPPNCLPQIKFPKESSLQINILSQVEFKLKTPGPGSRSIVFLKLPAKYTFFDASPLLNKFQNKSGQLPYQLILPNQNVMPERNRY